MVAVGDDELLVGHRGDDQVDEDGVGELPDAVDDSVFVGDGEVGWLGGGGFEFFVSVELGVGCRFIAEDEFFRGEGGGRSRACRSARSRRGWP